MNTPHISTLRARAGGGAPAAALLAALAVVLALAALLALPGTALAQADAAAQPAAGGGPAGVWQRIGPAGPESGSLLLLRADGVAAALEVTDAGDAVQAVSGVWQVDGSGTVSVFFDEAISGTDALAAGDDTLVLFGGGDLLNALVAPAALYGDSGAAFARLSAADASGVEAPGTLTFRSEVMPAASSPGRVYTLTLEPGGAASLAADTMNDEPPVVELGTWQADGLQVATVFTGTAATASSEPVSITFSLLGDGTQTLSATAYDEALFGSAGLALTYVAPGAEEAAGAPEGVAGVYTSKVLPGASSPGIVLTLALFENGNLLSTSNYLLDEPAITEQGTWSADETTVAITLTGQLDRAYTEPVTMTWDIAPPDQLASEGIVLTRLPQLTPEEMEAATAGLEDEQPSDTAGAYRSGWLPAASSPGLIRTLVLYDNGNLHSFSDYLTNDLPPITEFGTWSEDDTTVTITLTRQLDRDYDEPAIETFTKQAGALVQGTMTLNKLDQLLPGEQAAPEGTPGGEMELPGIYGSEWLAAASSPGLLVTLALYDNGAVQQTSNYLIDDGPALVEFGTWEAGAGTVTVTLTGSLDRDYEQPQTVTWQTAAPDQLFDGVMVLTRLEQITPQAMIEATAGAAAEVTDTAEVTGTAEVTATVEPAAGATPAPAEEPAATDEAGAGPSVLLPVAYYRSDVLPAAASPGRVVDLVVYGDSTLLMSTDYQDGRAPVVEIGTWQDNGGGVYTATLAGRLGRPYTTPVVIVFEEQGDRIVATDWDPTIYGSEGLTLIARDLGELE